MDFRNRESESWYLSANTAFGSVRWACKAQLSSSRGGVELGIERCSVGWRPVGCRKEVLKVEGNGWWRAGKEKRVGVGWVSWPRMVRKPPRESSSGSWGGWMERMPSSRRLDGVVVREGDHRREGQKAVSVRACEMVSKSMSREEAVERREARGAQVGSAEGAQSLWVR